MGTEQNKKPSGNFGFQPSRHVEERGYQPTNPGNGYQPGKSGGQSTPPSTGSSVQSPSTKK